MQHDPWAEVVDEIMFLIAAGAKAKLPDAHAPQEWSSRIHHLEEHLPAQVHVRDLIGQVDSRDIYRRWCSSPSGLPAVLGITGEDYLTIDLTTHGPHALVAGTTGSGKSELLISWLLQLALALPPTSLSVILVDYKGGAAFGPLEQLPHTAGVLTDLDPALTSRALASLRAEVLRREQLVARFGVKSIDQLPPIHVPARLLIVVDEFATLATTHPTLLDALMRVAAQGRSLGLHLILATQRPAGVVNASIRANTAVRICLRVIDEADSRDLVGHPACSLLSPTAGRFMVGGLSSAQECVFQAPWCGQSQDINSLIVALRRAAEFMELAAWKPWADPLPQRISRSLYAAEDTQVMPAALALIDEPEAQKVSTWAWDAHASLAILGATGSGKTTAAHSAALCFLSHAHIDRRDHVRIHICGDDPFVSEVFAYLRPWKGTSVDSSDPRRLARLFDLALRGTLTGDLLIVDDVDKVAAAIDESRGSGEGQIMIEQLCRLASSLQISLVVTAPLTQVHARWMSYIKLKFFMGVTQPSQAGALGLGKELVCEDIPGRAIFLAGSQARLAQIFVPEAGEAAFLASQLSQGPEHVSGAKELKAIPSYIAWDALNVPRCSGSQTEKESPSWGLGGDQATPLKAPTTHTFVIGPPGSGRSTVLRALQKSVGTRNSVLVVDDLDHASESTLTQIDDALSSGTLILASATTEFVAQSYRGIVAELKQRSQLVILWPTIGPTTALTSVALRSACDPRAPTTPGRGVLIHRGEAIPIQTADIQQKIKDFAL